MDGCFSHFSCICNWVDRVDFMEKEKNFYYEGTIDLKKVSDREEAVELLRWVIKELEAVSKPKVAPLD